MTVGGIIHTRLSVRSHLLALVLILAAAAVSVAHAQGQPIRINCGGPQYRAANGLVWEQDRYFVDGSKTYVSTRGIQATEDDALYQSERWQYKSKTPSVKYEIPMPNGQYDVRLLFAENYVSEENKRVFDVKMEGRTVLGDIDIFDEVGKHKKLDKTARGVAVTGGKLDIELIGKVGNPKIGAIEVVPISSSPAGRNSDTHPDIRYVANVIGDNPKGLSWADSYSVGDKCYCMTTFDHDIGEFLVHSPLGWKTVREVCELLGPGPGRQGRPIYNDIQCGNGPPNNAGDEHTCPGRVDIKREGCGHIGPKWNFDDFSDERPPKAIRFFLDTGGPSDTLSYMTTTGTTWSWGKKNIPIANNGDVPADVYRTHRSGTEVEYTIGGFEASAVYQVSLGFAEIYEPACVKGARIMSIAINDNPYERELDVFDRSGGCFKALVLRKVIQANVWGEFVVKIKASKENAMISSIDIMSVNGMV